MNYSLQETRRSYTRFLKSTKNKNITVLAKIGLFSVFSLIILMIIPAYADVGIAMIEEETFTLDDKFTISGTINDEGTVLLTAVIKGPGGEKYPNKNTYGKNGIFSFTPRDAGLIFSGKGTYTISVFSEEHVANRNDTCLYDPERSRILC